MLNLNLCPFYALLIVHFYNFAYCKNVLPLTDLDDICEINAVHGIYFTGIFAIINNVKSLIDCLSLCNHHSNCFSGTVIKIEDATYTCLLHSSKASKSYLVAENVIQKSAYFTMDCMSKFFAKKNAFALGKPARMCGVPFFGQPDDSRMMTRSRRILNGKEPLPYSQPWIGIVLDDNNQMCSISLITKNPNDDHTYWGISAAHCFLDNGKVLPLRRFGFLFGVHDLRILPPYAIYRRARRIILHKDYDTVHNDITLVKFAKIVRFNRYIRPICLPPTGQKQDLDFHQCTSCSWGVTNLENAKSSNSLRCLISEVTSELSSAKHQKYKSRHKIGYIHLKSKFQGIANGDSGGPVACTDQNLWNNQLRYTLHGIYRSAYYETVNNIVECYNHFSITGSFLDWITETMKERVMPTKRRRVCSNWRILSCYYVDESI